MRLEIAPEIIDPEGRAYSWRVVDLDSAPWGITQDGKTILAPISSSFEHASEAFAEKERLEKAASQ
jgi:hypothetical protein